MIGTINANMPGDFGSVYVYHATDLGLEPGEWDFVTDDGALLDYEFYEKAARIELDSKNEPITILGKTFKVSDIAKELCTDEWDAYVEVAIARGIANNKIRRIV